MNIFIRAVGNVFLLNYLLIFLLCIPAESSQTGSSGWTLFRKVQSTKPKALSSTGFFPGDLSGMFYNPALMAQVKGKELDIFSGSGFVDEKMASSLYAQPLKNNLSIGAGILTDDYGKMDLNWIEGNEIKTRSVSAQSDYLGMLAVGKAIKLNLDAGLSLKIAYSKIAETASAMALSFDGGINYLFNKNLSFSFVGQNFGLSTKFIDKSEKLPQTIMAGFSYFKDLNDFYVDLGGEIPYIITESRAIPTLGLEVGRWPLGVFTGWRFYGEEAKLIIGLEMALKNYSFSYAYTPGEVFDGMHRLAFSMRFNQVPDRRNEVVKEYEKNKDKIILERKKKAAEKEKKKKLAEANKRSFVPEAKITNESLKEVKIHFRTGEELTGKMLKENPDNIILRTGHGDFQVERKVILEIIDLPSSNKTNLVSQLVDTAKAVQESPQPLLPLSTSTIAFASTANNTNYQNSGTVADKFSRWRFWTGLGVLSGDLTYQIGGHYSGQEGSMNLWFPISELAWPLNVKVAIVGGEIYFDKNWEAGGELSKNFQTAAGKMKDSDWTEGDYPQLKTVYSESDADLQSITTDFSLRYWLSQQTLFTNTTLGFAVGGGWFYEHFDWEARNLDQWYPQNPEMGHDQVDGLLGTYEVTVNMPYLELTGKIEDQNNLSLLLRLGYSPSAEVKDADDHILRQISATSTLRGNAYKISLQGRYSFLSNWFVTGKWDRISFDMKGTSNNFIYGGIDQGYAWSIEQETSSTQNLLSLAVGLRF